MKYLLFLFILPWSSVFGQEVMLLPIIVSECELTENFDGLMFGPDGFEAHLVHDQILMLPDTGHYFALLSNHQSWSIDIKERGKLITDTIYFPKVSSPITMNIYYCCDNLCEGEILDWYDFEKTELKLKGTFQDGNPIDTVKEYFTENKLKHLFYQYPYEYTFWDKIKRNHFLSIYYYPNGNKESYYDSYEDQDIDYYENGNLKKWNTRKFRKTYFENGKTKKELILLHKKDSLIQFQDDTIEIRESDLLKIEYDSLGNKQYEVLWKEISEWDSNVFKGQTLPLGSHSEKGNKIQYSIRYDEEQPTKKVYSYESYTTKAGYLKEKVTILHYRLEDDKWIVVKGEIR